MKKIVAFVMAFAMVAGFFAYDAKEAKAADTTYYVAGSSGLCGVDWSENAAANAMTDNNDGTYTKVFADVQPGDYEFKVTNGTWSTTWGKDGNNYPLKVDEACDVTITFTLASGSITVEGDGVAAPIVEEVVPGYYVAGDSALCGSNWSQNDIANIMTDNGDGTWSKTYTDVQPATYAFKVTDGTWDNAWGDNGNNYILTIETACDVTITFTVETSTVTVTGDGISTAPIEYAEVFNVVGDAGFLGTGWDASGTTNTLVASGDGVYTLTLERVAASAAPYEFKVIQDAANYEWNGPCIYDAALLTNPDDVKSNMSITISEISDVTFTVTVGEDATTLTVTVTKSALAAEDVEAMIDALPSVDEVAISDKADVQAVKDVIEGLDEEVAADLDAEKAAKVDALLAKIAELEAAAADTANVILHFKNPNNWATVSIYAWVEAGTMFGDWPGTLVAEDSSNAGWHSVKFAYDADFSVIFNGGGEQTNDISIEVNEEGKTEVWIEMSDEVEEGGFGQATNVAVVSNEAPAGFVDGDEQIIEVNLPKTDDDTTDGDTTGGDDDATDGDDKTEGGEDDATTAWDDAKLKVHVQMPDVEGWDALGAYLFGTGENFGWKDGSGELTGSWPGVELLPEVNSENGWYAFGGTFADGYYMLILNNFVSDEAAAAGATKMQAADLEITDGEYWITIALDEETGKYVATVATEAPADYDGEGLETVVDTPGADEEPDGEDTPATPDDKDEAPDTGDAAPIVAVMMIALVAGASAVVIRRRKVA